MQRKKYNEESNTAAELWPLIDVNWDFYAHLGLFTA